MIRIGLFTVLAVFLSCNPEVGYKISQGSVIQSNVDCENQPGNSLALASTEDSPAPETCSEILNYQCDAEIFTSGIRNTKEQESVCLKTNECVQVTKNMFENSDPNTPQDTDYSCYLKEYVSDEGIFLFRGRADSLEKAMELAKSECLKGAIKK